MCNKCIYCGQEEDLSESDIIPDALTNARILNKNVCRIEHNNKFSDLFESEVIKELAFITNELDIKSHKGKNYAAYDAIVTIGGVDYDVSLHGDYEIFDGRVLKSVDGTNKMSSFEKMVKIAKDESKVQPIDVNNIAIEKKIRISNAIFYKIAMYRMISKIAFEWYCVKNNVIGFHQEFENIVLYITKGEGVNPVSIIQENELYRYFSKNVNLGSHCLFAYETKNNQIEVVISLFGLIMYRVVVASTKPAFCKNNFLFSELCTDSSRKEMVHESIESAENYFYQCLQPDQCKPLGCFGGLSLMMPKVIKDMKHFEMYPFLFNMIKCFVEIRNDAKSPNKNFNDIFLEQLIDIVQASGLHKKSIKRFVKETFSDKYTPIQINPQGCHKKVTLLFYAVFVIGLSGVDKLDEKIFQKIVREKLPYQDFDEIVITDEMEEQLKNEILKTENYSEILNQGARIIEKWS